MESVQAYNVTGSTLSEVASQFHTPYAAEVTWTLTLNGTTETTALPRQTTGECLFQSRTTVKTFEISISTTKELPNWSNINDAPCPEIRAEWNRFIAAANVHEEGHITIVSDFKTNDLPGYITRGKALTADGTGKTQAEADADAGAKIQQKVDDLKTEALKALQQKSDQYDNTTSHGASQGATLNTGIVCPNATPTPTATPTATPTP